jgi:hypothetical protein
MIFALFRLIDNGIPCLGDEIHAANHVRLIACSPARKSAMHCSLEPTRAAERDWAEEQ